MSWLSIIFFVLFAIALISGLVSTIYDLRATSQKKKEGGSSPKNQVLLGLSALTEECNTDKLLLVLFTILEDELKYSIETIALYDDEEMIGKVRCNLCDYADAELIFSEMAIQFIGQNKPGKLSEIDPVYVCPHCLQYKSFCLYKEENFVKSE